ncbi:aldo/keto reductase [Vulgatibacter sp.]|uniref:aldo/keto reductase n=1 Tax=Vulgatibacter sp. TaxID=1971226 RepID=UPI0035678087
MDEADLAAVGYTTLGKTGLQVSRLGFGTFRVDDRAAPHKEALATALQHGVNLIDTSGNYADGHAEIAVGQVLAELFAKGTISRQQVVVAGKIGVLQGESLREMREREAEEKPVPGVVHFQDGVWSCIHPAWIEEQIGASLQRLQLDGLDIVLLHNPEIFLADAQTNRRGVSIEQVREQFYGRIERAFEQLEKECKAGRIGWYGISSNTLAAPAAEPQAIDLQRLVQAAKAAARKVGAADDHFAVVEVPLNLYENRPATLALGDQGTFLAQAEMAGLAVLTNRPLNAILGPNRLLRLAEPPQMPNAPKLADAAAEVQAIEAVFAQDFAPKIKVQGGPPPTEIFRWGTELADAPAKLTGIEHWMAMQAQVIGPQVQTLLGQLGQGFKNDASFQAWAKRYVESLNKLLAAVSGALVEKLGAEAAQLKSRLAGQVPERWQGASLSRQALGTLLSTGGVTTVLVGMRNKKYVEDALGAVALEPIAPATITQVYEAFARQGA